ncbi:MAG TPA: peptidylprolyl isomerase [Gemmataceae bacterium]|nr:peptidylprolyl isomerase [Gemmataceae bacterium]
MAIRGDRWIWAIRPSGLAGVLLGIFLGGCDQTPSGGRNGEQTASSSHLNNASGHEDYPPPDPRLQQTFAEATRNEPPPEWERPPDLTLAGKSVGTLYTEVVRLWEGIRFTTDSGQPISYTASIDTELGPIEISLRPELAPNHVRNFIALARAGYYDGLVFERTVREKPDDQSDGDVEVLEGGCPLGRGDIGLGSIGYWLKPEFTKEPHEVGTVGASHGAEPDTAACSFYITLSKAPFLDGNFTVFGKVTEGIDIARRIFSLPVRNDSKYPEGDRPEKPVVIRKVTIHSSETTGQDAK